MQLIRSLYLYREGIWTLKEKQELYYYKRIPELPLESKSDTNSSLKTASSSYDSFCCRTFLNSIYLPAILKR